MGDRTYPHAAHEPASHWDGSLMSRADGAAIIATGVIVDPMQNPSGRTGRGASVPGITVPGHISDLEPRKEFHHATT